MNHTKITFHTSFGRRIQGSLRSLCAACLVFLAMTVSALSAFASSVDDTISAIVEHSMAQRGASGFYDGLEYGYADRTAFCYAKLFGEEGAEPYLQSAEAAAHALLTAEGFTPPTEFQRAVVLLSAFGHCPRELINAAAYRNENFDKQGINAWIWALIAINCCGIGADDSALFTADDIAREIVSRQLPDGGFNLKGNGADADITAAAIYALAPLGESFGEEISAAVLRLSQLQLESGGFSTMGNENCESTAQAIIAFTSVGLDESDPRVASALSAMMGYYLGDGTFTHLPEGKSNGIATTQAFEALTALKLAKSGQRLYDLSPDHAGEGGTPGGTESGSDASQGATESGGAGGAQGGSDASQGTTESEGAGGAQGGSDASQSAAEGTGLSGGEIKLIITLALAVAALTLAVLFVVKRRWALLLSAVVLALCAVGAQFLDIKSPEEYYAQSSGGDFTVTLSVNCSDALAHIGDIDESVNPPSVVPENGLIIPPAEISVTEGATAFDALIIAARNGQVRVDYIGSMYGEYVRSIGGLREFGFGSGSGWLYRVNGEYPEMSAGSFKLSAGDNVEFIYTCG